MNINYKIKTLTYNVCKYIIRILIFINVINNFIKKDYEKLILDTIKKVGGTKLKPVKDELPSEVDYMCIKSVWYKYKDTI